MLNVVVSIERNIYMKINFNAMPSKQGFGGNCIGRNARKNLNNGKNAIAADVGQLIKHSENNHAEYAEILDIPLYRVLTIQNKKMENRSSDLMFVTERTKRNTCDSDDDLELSGMENQYSDSIIGKTENSLNFDDASEEYEMCRTESLELDEEDLEIMQNYKNTDEKYLASLQNYKNIDELLNKVEKLDVSEEKKHDFLMETVIYLEIYFKFIDSLQISDEEKLKRKLEFIDEAYQDEGMRLKKRMQLMKSSEIK